MVASPRWFLSAASRVLPEVWAGVADVGAKGGDNLQSSGQAVLPTPSLSSPCFHCIASFSRMRDGSLWHPGDKSDTTRPGGKAGGDS